eukprot:TRINITY_DN2921_c0_g1_i1.p1 TRINITY_DN2921_c0_g1~~TRINITY_DN2921_c0_g1_i1.p1  ORF type:complete len:201 (+),score=51.32 TRINITY_DN2921_c0_g1_i1:60-662(+)
MAKEKSGNGSIRLVIVGKANSGKSCLVIRFVAGKWVPEYDPTLEDAYRKMMDMEERGVHVVDIFDTAGTEDFAMIRDGNIRTGDGFICAFSTTDRESYEFAQTMIRKIATIKDDEYSAIPMVLVGTKKDLINQRQVTNEEGQQLADTIGKKYIETSSLTGENIEEVFLHLAKFAMERKDIRIAAASPRGSPKSRRDCCIL